MKLNTDGSINLGNQVAACGGLIRNHDGSTIAGFLANVGNCSIAMAEFGRLYIGISLAFSLGIRSILAETDSLCAINLLQQ